MSRNGSGAAAEAAANRGEWGRWRAHSEGRSAFLDEGSEVSA